MVEEIVELLNDADDVMESVEYDPFGMNIVTPSLEGVSMNSITSDQLQDPLVIKQLKKQIKSAKKWQTVLGIITKLNVLLSSVTVVGGAVTASSIINNSSKVLTPHETGNYDSITGKPEMTHSYELSGDVVKKAKLAILIPIIQLAVTVLTAIVKKAITSKEIKDISVLKTQIDKSISLYESRLKYIVYDSEKEKLKTTIKELKDLKYLIYKEADRLDSIDKVMDSVEYDPFGMDVSLESVPTMYSMASNQMDKIDGYDLSKEEDIKKTSRILS